MNLLKLKVAITLALKAFRLAYGLKDLKLDGKLTEDEVKLIFTQVNLEILPMLGVSEDSVQKILLFAEIGKVADSLPDLSKVRVPDWLAQSPKERAEAIKKIIGE